MLICPKDIFKRRLQKQRSKSYTVNPTALSQLVIENGWQHLNDGCT